MAAAFSHMAARQTGKGRRRAWVTSIPVITLITLLFISVLSWLFAASLVICVKLMMLGSLCKMATSISFFPVHLIKQLNFLKLSFLRYPSIFNRITSYLLGFGFVYFCLFVLVWFALLCFVSGWGLISMSLVQIRYEYIIWADSVIFPTVPQRWEKKMACHRVKGIRPARDGVSQTSLFLPWKPHCYTW